ncbi:MAG: RNA-binding transcriptional accessory protein, partial [Acholeplasmatales bacterium]|nr:RNA-binding transcriptional accessory protein [Acholeplasmatales bacterium]
MDNELLEEVSRNLNLNIKDCEATLKLLEDGATVPFIARYRKEMTHGLDENQIRAISDAYSYTVDLKKRKDDVKRLINEKGLLTDELAGRIDMCKKLVEVEDIYRPYKEKKQTKATKAIALGLEALAKIMMSFPTSGSREEIALKYQKDDLTDPNEIILNAGYIIAEWVSDNAAYRSYIRDKASSFASIVTKIKKNATDEMEVYKNYYDYSEQISKIKNHRVLAINRGENEGILSVSLAFDDERYIEFLNRHIIKNEASIFTSDIKDAIIDSYKRLIKPSIEREIRNNLSKEASDSAIKVFSLNLKNLLLQAPIKGKMVLGVDPAFRTGCKMAVIDSQGNVLDKNVIYPNERSKGSVANEADVKKSKVIVASLCKKYNIDLIAIGNGTASRETEEFIAQTIKEYSLKAKYVIVSEAGASVYSASKIAQEEFPDYHVEERSAVSIARRLEDPLAELVKIDPKSIGVGQYQHDVNPTDLETSLNRVVEDAVNSVGVDVNTASASLLSHVAGINKTIAENIVEYRKANGGIKSRKELLKVSKLGPKAYEQCVGFTRVPDSDNILDNTRIHPESYDKALRIMKELNITSIGDDAAKKAVGSCNREMIQKNVDVDKYTLDDILDAIVAPTRDPRDEYAQPKLRDDIKHFEDLKIGEELMGTVRNVVDFGAFVDCGVKYDGLVHISKISKGYIKHPSDVLSVGDIIKVYVIGVDMQKHKL